MEFWLKFSLKELMKNRCTFIILCEIFPRKPSLLSRDTFDMVEFVPTYCLLR